MIQARVLDPKSAAKEVTFTRFPARLGRSPSADLTLETAGFWEQHLELHLRGAGVFIRVCPPAVATLNGQSLLEAPLKNGDVVQAGATTIQFWLSPLEQRSLKTREAMTWTALVLISLCQVCLIYWLLRLTARSF